MSIYKSALQYAEKGWKIVQLVPKGKRPTSSQTSYLNATSDPETLTKWWTTPSDAWSIEGNVGIQPAASGLIVLDVDNKNGGYASLKKLEDEYGKLTTRSVTTGSGGLHYYFKAPSQKITNKLGKWPGIDIISVANHVVAPPSIHETGGIYRWNDETTPIEEFPEFLLKLLTPATTSLTPVTFKVPTEVIPFDYMEECPFFRETAKPGTWNSLLYQAAKDMQANGYSAEFVASECAKMSPEGLLDGNDLGTIRSAFSSPPSHAPKTSRRTSSVEAWFRGWMKDNEVRYSYKNDETYLRGRSITIDVMFARLFLDNKQWAEENPHINKKGEEVQRIPHGEAALKFVLTVWMDEQHEKTVDHYRKLLAYDETVDKEGLPRFLEILTGKRDNLDLAVLRHFIWQIKRKLNKLEVAWHVMPIIHGQTGGGKTRAVEALLAPIDELVNAPPNLKCLEDSREGVLLSKYYVVFFDEMSKANTVEVESIKNKITAKNQSYRKLGTNHIITTPNASTFIGAANKDLRDLIIDNTSARRFWQINTLDVIPYHEYLGLDWLSMWKSVDENAESPIMMFLSEILAYQHENLRRKDSIETWIDETTERCENGMRCTELYNLYRDWMMDQGIRNFPMRDTFSRELTRLKVEKVRRTTGVYYHLKLKNLPEKFDPNKFRINN